MKWLSHARIDSTCEDARSSLGRNSQPDIAASLDRHVECWQHGNGIAIVVKSVDSCTYTNVARLRTFVSIAGCPTQG